MKCTGSFCARLLFLLLIWLPAAALQAADSTADYDVRTSDSSVSMVRQDGAAWASLKVMTPELSLYSTKDYAQYVMDSFRGWDLKAVLDLRGFSFKYVDNAPCAGLVTYFDGRSYLLFQACGLLTAAELHSLYSEAAVRLKLYETLQRSAKPTLY